MAIREAVRKRHEIQRAAGEADDDGIVVLDLAEARIALAQERGQHDAVVAALREMFAIRERRAHRMQAIGSDRFSSAEVDGARVALLEAEIQLLKAQR